MDFLLSKSAAAFAPRYDDRRRPSRSCQSRTRGGLGDLLGWPPLRARRS